jgi:hypothetical protein
MPNNKLKFKPRHGHAQRIIVRLPTRLYNPAPNQMMNDGILVKLAERGKGIDHDMLVKRDEEAGNYTVPYHTIIIQGHLCPPAFMPFSL